LATDNGKTRGSGGRVVVGDGDSDSRALAARLLRTVGFDVLEAASGETALAAARETRPAAVLLDVELADISGYQVCHMLRAEWGQSLPILLMSASRTEPYDRAAGLLLGANEYLTKPFAAPELLAWVETNGRPPRSEVQPPPEGRGNDLTPSELRVLRLLASGMPPQDIGLELSIAPKTVSMHIHNSMKKLDVHTRTEAVALAHRLGLVEAKPEPLQA